jgi:hypothetical protein
MADPYLEDKESGIISYTLYIVEVQLIGEEIQSIALPSKLLKAGTLGDCYGVTGISASHAPEFPPKGGRHPLSHVFTRLSTISRVDNVFPLFVSHLQKLGGSRNVTFVES